MIETVVQIFEYVLHLDLYINQMIDAVGIFSYLILFLAVFAETAFVVTVFLPSDTILFAACALSAASNSLWMAILVPLFFVAALLGDNLNFRIGRFFCRKVQERQKILFIKQKNIDKASSIFERNGTTAIIIARFIPILRSLAPFVAGVSDKSHEWFAKRNLIGCTIWTVFFCALGYFFGNIDFVKDNFGIIIIGIACLTIITALLSTVLSRIFLNRKNASK
jgi:membrane-associated protein